MDPNVPRSKGPRRGFRSDVLGFGEGSKAPIPHVPFQFWASVDELEGVLGDLAVDSGQVHHPVPTVPRADDGSEARGPSSGGKADELHPTLPRFESRTHPQSGRARSPSRHAEGDSQPSPAGWACGMFSDQLRTYSGSRYAYPAVVIRMLSKYVSSMTARRACIFPRAARDRCAAFPWGLCGVDPGWNVNEPSSTTPSRAP